MRRIHLFAAALAAPLLSCGSGARAVKAPVTELAPMTVEVRNLTSRSIGLYYRNGSRLERVVAVRPLGSATLTLPPERGRLIGYTTDHERRALRLTWHRIEDVHGRSYRIDAELSHHTPRVRPRARPSSLAGGPG